MIALSILSANFNNLKEEIDKCQHDHVKYLHLDIMDGHFVPNLSFGSCVLKNLKKETNLFFDTHLMVTNPFDYVEEFASLGSDIITFHYESTFNKTFDLINFIKSKNIKVGVSIKPKTEVKEIFKYLENIDLILVMSVEPGFGGQKFISSSLEKIRKLKKIKNEKNLNYIIEVDGGINEATYKLCKQEGCDLFVCGSYIFNSDNYKFQIEKLIGGKI